MNSGHRGHESDLKAMASREKGNEIPFHGRAFEAVEKKALVWVTFREAAACRCFL